jgi:hypothetical protein
MAQARWRERGHGQGALESLVERIDETVGQGLRDMEKFEGEGGYQPSLRRISGAR